MIFVLPEHKVIQRLNYMGLQVLKSYRSLIEPSGDRSASQKKRQILAVENMGIYCLLPPPIPHPGIKSIR